MRDGDVGKEGMMPVRPAYNFRCDRPARKTEASRCWERYNFRGCTNIGHELPNVNKPSKRTGVEVETRRLGATRNPQTLTRPRDPN